MFVVLAHADNKWLQIGSYPTRERAEREAELARVSLIDATMVRVDDIAAMAKAVANTSEALRLGISVCNDAHFTRALAQLGLTEFEIEMVKRCLLEKVKVRIDDDGRYHWTEESERLYQDAIAE